MEELNILGLNLVFHDSSSVILNEGSIAFAVEEERWYRDDKHTDVFPKRSIMRCLEAINCQKGDLRDVAINMNPILCLSNASSMRQVIASPNKWNRKHWQNYRIRKKDCEDIEWLVHRVLMEMGIDQAFRFHRVGHHDSHAASAFFVSPFEESAVLTVDANGEWTTLSTYLGKENSLVNLSTVGLPNSIGGFYASITEYLGFKRNNDEFKVMGLAAYGDPLRYKKLINKLIFPTSDGLFNLDNSYFDYAAYKISANHKLSQLFGFRARSTNEPLEQRHKDLAAALQLRTEEILVHIAQNLQEKTKSKNLCLAGGVALNCVMNSALLARTNFENIFIQPAAYDSGSALGAALWVRHQKYNLPRTSVMTSANLGPQYSNDEIELILKEGMLTYIKSDDIAKDAAKLIAENNIVGWLQGRAEFGPRALGYRSILANPMDANMQNHLNKRVKHRESFRPFAPACPMEDYIDYFEWPHPDEFMTKINSVRPEWRSRLPSITHIDGTARLQTVSKKNNVLFHKLLKEFEKIAGVPIVINTSFNVNGEPMVLSPKDAIRCFMTTGIDCLIMGDFILIKKKL